MSIKKIDKNELRGYEGKEGLILHHNRLGNCRSLL